LVLETGLPTEETLLAWFEEDKGKDLKLELLTRLPTEETLLAWFEEDKGKDLRLELLTGLDILLALPFCPGVLNNDL
jgi:hypothetical protein